VTAVAGPFDKAVAEARTALRDFSYGYSTATVEDFARHVRALLDELHRLRVERIVAVVYGAPRFEMECPRPFALYRHEDDTGVSGTGVVAYGVQFADGNVALRWRGAHASTVVWSSLDDALAVHGHNGRTVLVWLVDSEGD